jgi:hypothetical protein
MRMAGRFARRVKAWGQANQVPVIFCKKGERKHLVVEEYLASHPVAGPGVMSRDAAVGRLSQVCNRWIYTACLCFGLDLAEQARTGFGYSYSIYQVEYSRNLIFADGASAADAAPGRHRRGPDPHPAGRTVAADPVRHQAAAPQPGQGRPVTPAVSRDRDTSTT